MLCSFEREIIPVARHFGMALALWDISSAMDNAKRKRKSNDVMRMESAFAASSILN